jgi:RimJ/RimL family protein N-acetyltransferase
MYDVLILVSEKVPLMDIPEITTSRLRLKAVSLRDAEDIHRYVSNPNVLRYTS